MALIEWIEWQKSGKRESGKRKTKPKPKKGGKTSESRKMAEGQKIGAAAKRHRWHTQESKKITPFGVFRGFKSEGVPAVAGDDGADDLASPLPDNSGSKSQKRGNHETHSAAESQSKAESGKREALYAEALRGTKQVFPRGGQMVRESRQNT